MRKLNRRDLLRTSVLVTAGGLLAACQPVMPPTPTPGAPPTATPALPPPQRILIIGDGYVDANLGMDVHLQRLAAEGLPDAGVSASRVVNNRGMLLLDQWEDGEAVPAIESGDWDVVVLMEDPARADWNEQTSGEVAAQFDALIREAGGRTVLFTPWAYYQDMPIEEIVAYYDALAAQLGVPTAPVGQAIARVQAERPDLQLLAPHHTGALPSFYGTYLAALVLYAVIFGQNPEGLTYLPTDALPDSDLVETVRARWGLSEEDRAYLQRVAWEAVKG